MHNKLKGDKTTPMSLLLVWILLIGYKSACYDGTHTANYSTDQSQRPGLTRL